MAGLSFYFSEQILKILVKPLGDIQLYVTEVTGSFYAYLKVSLLTGIVASLPVLFYQMWAFISPGLFASEKKAVLPLVAVSTGLFLLGTSFCYYVTLPISLQFLIAVIVLYFSTLLSMSSSKPNR